MTESWWAPCAGGVTVSVRVMPGARISEVVDASGAQLRVRIAAPAIEGKANIELQRFLAADFGVRRSAITVVRGMHARDKIVRIEGIAAPP